MVTENGQSDGNTSFLRAARNGHLDKVLEHLKSNIDINTSNANGLNALHLASKDGHVEIVKELLKRGAVVDAATKKGNTALHIASLAGQEEVVKLLVQHGASVNVQSQNGFTPLYMAAQENHDNVVKFLLANGANQSLSTEDGFTPLAVAMQQGHDKVVTVLLENDTRGKVRLPALHIAAKKDDVKAAKLLLENEHNPDVTSKSGFTPLHIASHYGNQQIANLLIQKGADVNYAAKHNITPLHVAAKWGKTNMVALLLENGATIDSKTRDGLTPLHCAARSGHEQVVDMLLERGAPISCKTKNGLAPLHMAAQGDHVDAARILLYHRAPVDEVTVDYLTALHVAAHCGHVRVAKLLLDRQADANARALNGFTPLHIACKKNRIKVVELLLKHGGNIGATTESGLTPLHVASFMGCMNIVIYLLQHDANPDVPTVRGETPLHLAARANQTDIIRILLRNGAQVDARAREQQTPLHIASRLGNVDIVMLLLQHGAKVDNTTKDMYTALHIASKEGQDEVAAVLLDNGASLDATTKKGFTPLHLAAKYDHLKVANLLLQKEVPVDAQGKNGVTPLHVASHYDHQNVALLLLDKGASPHATAKNGHTPLHIAARKNQMDIANTLLEYGAQPNAESKAGFTPLHLSAQEGHSEMSSLLLEHQANPNHEAKNGLTPLHLCAQEDRVPVAEVLVKNGANVNSATKGGYTPLHIASHYGQVNMVRFLLKNGANIESVTSLNYTPLHQAAQQGHANIVNVLLENNANPDAVTTNGQTPLTIAQKLGYITVIETLKVVTTTTTITTTTTTNIEEKYRVQAPELMHETFMSDSEEEGGEDTVLGDQTYRYLTADEMKSLGDDSLPIDVTRDERIDSNRMVSSADSNMLPPQHIEDSISPEHVTHNYVEYIKKYTPDNVDISRHPISIGKLHWKNFLVSFLVDARGGAMRGCRHSGVRVIVPPRCAPSPTRITCRYVRPQRTPHPPPLMEGEALASRVLELGPVGAKFLGPVIIEVPHFAALRGKEREIVILRSDNGESWKEHTVEATEEVLNDVLHDSFEAEDLNQLEDMSSGRITRIVTQDFPQYFAVVSRIRQEVHAIGPEGGMVSSTVVPQVQAVFPEGALTKKIKVGLQAQPIDPELTAKLLGHGVAVSPVVTVEPRRRKFHKAITLSMPAPRAHSQGMINQYSGSAPTLRLLCSITGGTTRAQWEDVTGSTPLTFVNDCVSFTTTVSARFWLMDCRNISDATKMATELYKEAIHVPFMAKFVVFAKRVDPLEARLRVFCMTDDKEDKTLEHQEHFTEVAKSRDVEVLEGKLQYIEFAGNLVPITKSGEQLSFSFRAFRENRLPFTVRVKDQHAEAVSRCLFMKEPKVPKGEEPQQPICILNILLPDDIVTETISLTDTDSLKKYRMVSENFDYYRPDPRLADMSNLLGEDWVPLANQLGLTTSEINVIKSEYPDSVAKQAQSMLRMWLSQTGNKAQTNTLENALRRIGREDIIPQCLNPDQSDHVVTRVRQEEIVKHRLKSERDNILEKADDVAVRIDRKEVRKIHNLPDKYSAEEKAIEKSDEEEDETFDKPVAEIRERIEKRLSAERSIPASSQRKEIVQEITTIKQQSLVEDKLAEVEQKVLEQKEITKPTMTKVLPGQPEVKMVSKTVEIKTTETPSEPMVSETVTTTTVITTTETRTTVPDEQVAHKTEEDMDLLKGVTRSFENIKTPATNLMADEDPKSPKYSKTPPPSPADFLIKDRATTVRDWEASSQPLEPESRTPKLEEDASQEESSCVQLTEIEAAKPLTPIDTNLIPQPKPRTLKTPEATNISEQTEEILVEKPISPVRDDLLDSDEVPETYSDKKKFWENVIQESSQTKIQKRMSFQETTTTEKKEQDQKKRVSIHEISTPVPKPRTTLQSSLSVVETDELADTKEIDLQESATQDAFKTSVKERAMSYETTTEEPSKISPPAKPEPKMMSEYQEAFQAPTEKRPILKKSLSQDKQLKKKDSFDSDIGFKGSGNNMENAGYISDSEDVEHYISDSEIEDRVPQIRDRLMSVFVPTASSSNKSSIYTRSASLPTEDLYEVSARSIKARKEYYEAQIRKEMIEEQLTSDIEEAPSPEVKNVMSSEEDHTEADARSIGEDVEDLVDEKIREENKIEKLPNEKVITFILPEQEPKQEEEFVTEQVLTQVKVEEQIKLPEETQESEIKIISGVTTKSSEDELETDNEIPHKLIESQQSISSDRSGDMLEEQNYRDDSHSTKPDSMEVLVDKSEIEDSEKFADLDQEMEGRSVDSLDIDDMPKMMNSEDAIADGREKIEATVNVPHEQIPDTLWEVSVQSHSEKFIEKAEEIAPVQTSRLPSRKDEQSSELIQKEQQPEIKLTTKTDPLTLETFLHEEKKMSLPTPSEFVGVRKASSDTGEEIVLTKDREDDFSSSVRDESDLGSEIHQDHSESYDSDKFKSDSHSEIEKIILDSLHQQKVHPDEAQKIANALIEEIEAEIQKRHFEPTEKIEAEVLEKAQVSELLKHLAETKGLDEREVQLVQSVLARKQRLQRGDTASSMEITDEDLKFSGAETDYSHMLEQQIDQLEAEQVSITTSMKTQLDEMSKLGQEKSKLSDKTFEQHSEETESSQDSKFYDNEKTISIKEHAKMKSADLIKNEKYQHEEKEISEDKDEVISKMTTRDNQTTETDLEAEIKQEKETFGKDISSTELTSGVIKHTSDHTTKSITDKTTSQSKEAVQDILTEKTQIKDDSKLSSAYEIISTTTEETEGSIKEEVSEKEEKYDEISEKEEDSEKKRIHQRTKQLDGTEIETKIDIDKIHSKTSSTVTHTVHEETKTTSEQILSDLSSNLEDLLKTGAIPKEETEYFEKRELFEETQSSETKSNETMKSPDDTDKEIMDFSKTNEFEKSPPIVWRKSKSDTSSDSPQLKPDRKSGVEFEVYSSSGESHYHSFELDSGKSRPCSSDVEGLLAAGSSEYDTAVSHDMSSKSHITSTTTDYHTPVSSMSSKGSMKSLDSESSGNLGSIEVSEHSETLVPSSSDLEDLVDLDQHLLPYESLQKSSWSKQEGSERQSLELSDSELVGKTLESVDMSEEEILEPKIAEGQSKMKRSCEMTFQPEPKVLAPESPQAETEEKLGTSLDDGSVFSMSVSSTSSTGQQKTVIEVSAADSERLDGSMTVSVTPDHMSMEELETKDNQEHVSTTPVPTTIDSSTSTLETSQAVPIQSVTITTTIVQESGVQSVNTQVISKEETEPISKVIEPKKKGHRRTESTLGTITIPGSIKKTQPEMPDLNESPTTLSSKENISDEKKDVDESEKELVSDLVKERLLSTDSRDTRVETESDFEPDNFDLSRPQSVFSKSDSERPASTAFSDDRPDSELADLVKSSDLTEDTDLNERPLTPEPTEDIKEQLSFDEPSLKDQDALRSHGTTVFETISKFDTYIRKDSHGKSSSTSSEKSSFEEAEAEPVFSMVAHISPAHKAKQICPIMEDEDAEKHELEAKELAQKEREASQKRYAEMIKDMSPGFVPDIKITQHMAPLEDSSFHYPDLDLEAKERETQQIGTDTPQTPASNSSKSSEETDQGKEYILDETIPTVPEEPEGVSEEITQSKTEIATSIETSVKELTEREGGADSPSSSESFEMVDKPDLMDDFVVIEEVGKEASELDREGKSVGIEPVPRPSKKHDEEIERYLAHSAPTPLTRMTDAKYYPDGSSSEEIGFDFEESPPQIEQQRAQDYNRELEDNRKWIENQFKNDHAAMIAAGYGYEMEFERAPLEDIKEEDVNDFAASSYGSQKDSGGSVKESYSSTPEYDVLAGRKYFTRGEHDDVSMSSLQEFENLEKAMSLEMRKFYQGSDSSSNGSFKTRYVISKSGQGDDISTSSLKEFEGLEKACIAAHTIEIKAKEEEALLAQIEEGQESIASETESCETVPTQEKKKASDTEDDEDYEKRMFEIDEIIRQAQTNVERFTDLKELEKTESLGRGDSIEEVSRVPDLELDTPLVKSTIKVQWKDSEDIMIASSDSLDFKDEKPSRQDSSDSLDQETGGNLMTASTDSIEFQAQKSSKENIMTDSIELKADEKSFPMSLDSLEPSGGGAIATAAVFHDSIDEDSSRKGIYDHSTSSTGRDFSSSARDEEIEQGKDHVEFSEGLDITSSTATNATYQYDTDSIYSGSFTSGGSNTMVSSTNSVDQMKSVVSVDIGEAARKVWFDESVNAMKTTEYIDETSKPYVTELIEPSEDDQYSHVIHRRVEMPPEVRKVTFTGSNVDEQMRQFIEGFKEGEESFETEEVDEDGNVHVKRVVQRRFIVKDDGSQQPMSGPEIEEYFKKLGQPETSQGEATFTQEISVKKRDSTGGDVSQTTMTQQIGPTSILKTRTTRDTQETSKETEQPSTSTVRAEEGAGESDETTSERKVSDQHQLSEEMKELLRELEKESKQ